MREETCAAELHMQIRVAVVDVQDGGSSSMLISIITDGLAVMEDERADVTVRPLQGDALT